jgi:hypothetical protein
MNVIGLTNSAVRVPFCATSIRAPKSSLWTGSIYDRWRS